MELRGDGTVYRQRGSRYLWLQYYVKGERVRESSGTDNPREASKILRQKLAAVDNGEIGAGGKSKLAELFAALERDYVINGRKDLASVKSRWTNHLFPFFGNFSLSQTNSEAISRYVTLRKTAGAENATVNRELAILKRMYKLAVKSGRLKVGQQPYIEMLKERNVRKGFLRDEQYTALAAETAKIGLWLRTMFELGYSYGWRANELIEMRIEQIDLMKRVIFLNPGETKNEEGREVAMTDKVFELLGACARGKSASDFVLTRESDRWRLGKNLTGRKPKAQRIWSYDEAWTAAKNAAACPTLLFHDLRRTAVRNMIAAGIPEKVAMMISGHKTRAIFDRYHIVDSRKLEEAARRMDQAARDRQTRAQLLSQQQIEFTAIEASKSAAARSSQERHSSDIATNSPKPN